jgi:hypothetical protein
MAVTSRSTLLRIRAYSARNVWRYTRVIRSRQTDKTIYKKHYQWLAENLTVITMIWLNATEYLSYRWPWIGSVCRKHNHVLLPSFITNRRMFNKDITTGSTSVAGTAWEIYTLYEIAAEVLLHLYRKLLFCFNVVFSTQMLLTDKIDTHTTMRKVSYFMKYMWIIHGLLIHFVL